MLDFELPLSVLYRTKYNRRPEHIVPRLTTETKDNFFIATLQQNGFAVEVEGDDVSPSLSQTVSLTKLLITDIVRRGKSPTRLKIKLTKTLPAGYSRYQLKVTVLRNSEKYQYRIDSRGNRF